MIQAFDRSEWTGRDDSQESGDVRRLFQIVEGARPENIPAQSPVLLGFACDAGVARNKGRTGSAQGPSAIRKILSGFPAHHFQKLFDCGNVVCKDDALESAQELLGHQVSQILAQDCAPVILGGGHEIAWGSFLGLKQWLVNQEISTGRARKLLILNLDAHLDLRGSRPASSGTPFDQIASDCLHDNRHLQYACWGVSVLGNTPALFARAAEINADVILDHQLQERHLDLALARLDRLLALVDDVYLTIDMDVFPASVVPGVSAPAAFGVPLSVVEALAISVKRSGKMRLADIAEFNPVFDTDQHSARVAARLAWMLLG
jgi:formiminoglutamase